ncbi:MAG: cupin domain-containing protein, partial [Oscillospiraceae bacterium]|nr:cupin domain-containing protein [Oscillospiraceae bacterium]
MMHDIFKLRYRVLPIASCEIVRAAKTMPETVTALHNHKEFELLSITSGQVRITIGDIPYTVSAGDLVLVNSYALHAIEVEIGRSFSADCLSFDLSLLEEEAFSRLLEQGEYETVPLVPATHPLHGPLAACFEQAMSACG